MNGNHPSFATFRNQPFLFPDDFVENAFVRRFQAIILHAMSVATWLIVAAVPGSGKSTGIKDLVQQARASKHPDGQTRLPILAARVSQDSKTATSLGCAIADQMGVVPRMPWDQRRTWIVRQMVRLRVKLLIVDDAHYLSKDQLAYLKSLTDDLLAAPHDHKIGLCLVGATSGQVIPVKEIIEQDSNTVSQWQYRRRLDATRPYNLVLGHTENEVMEICQAYEQLIRERFPERFPNIRLLRWAHSIHEHLTTPAFDLDGSRRVSMDNLCKLIRKVVENAHDIGRTDIDDELIQNAIVELKHAPKKPKHIDGQVEDEQLAIAG